MKWEDEEPRSKWLKEVMKDLSEVGINKPEEKPTSKKVWCSLSKKDGC